MDRVTDEQQPLSTAELSAHLWDLRSQAEAKLRCLTRLQQALADYATCAGIQSRALKRAHIFEDLKDIVTISQSLTSVAERAVAAAESLLKRVDRRPTCGLLRPTPVRSTRRPHPRRQSIQRSSRLTEVEHCAFASDGHERAASTVEHKRSSGS